MCHNQRYIFYTGGKVLNFDSCENQLQLALLQGEPSYLTSNVSTQIEEVNKVPLPQQPLPSLCADERAELLAFNENGGTRVFLGTQKLIFPFVPLLSKVFEFIEANYHLSITLSDVAQAVGYSPAYLTNLVGSQTGKTVNRWIIQRRMVAACSLLMDTNQSAEQIATAIGYQNVCYFFRQFRQHHGMTPCSWRKAHQNQSLRARLTV